ncbi:MAG: porin family protein [Rickettsiales bacterium]|jgi:hypothetical protein|nr:porin family protein [Rickettsiales bacterium]
MDNGDNLLKNLWTILLFVVCVPLLVREAMADVTLSLPDGIETRRLNEDRPRKLTNLYKNTGQIGDQYRGKLKYRPDNNGVIYYRDGRFYVSIYFFVKNFSLQKIENDKISPEIVTGKLEHSYSSTFGYYFTKNFSIEFEYFDYSDSLSDIIPPIENTVKDGTVETRNYIFNFMTEINQSRIIPFFAVGFGVVKSDFSHTKADFLDSDFKINSKFTPLYQFIAGFEFMVTDQLLLSFRYRLYNTFVDLRSSDGYIFGYGPRNNFNIGFKYIL